MFWKLGLYPATKSSTLSTLSHGCMYARLPDLTPCAPIHPKYVAELAASVNVFSSNSRRESLGETYVYSLCLVPNFGHLPL